MWVCVHVCVVCMCVCTGPPTGTHTRAAAADLSGQVTWRADLNAWQPTGIYHRLLLESSLLPDPEQLKAFEGSDIFRDMAYMDIDLYRQKVGRRGPVPPASCVPHPLCVLSVVRPIPLLAFAATQRSAPVCCLSSSRRSRSEGRGGKGAGAPCRGMPPPCRPKTLPPRPRTARLRPRRAPEARSRRW